MGTADKKPTPIIKTDQKPEQSNLKIESVTKVKEQTLPKAQNETPAKIAETAKVVTQEANNIPIKGNVKPKSAGEGTPMSDKVTKQEEKNASKSTIITQAKESKASETVDKKPPVNAVVDIKNDINKQKVEKVKQLVEKQPNKPDAKVQKQSEQIVNTSKQTKINEIKETKKVEVANVKDISTVHQKENVDLILAPVF